MYKFSLETVLTYRKNIEKRYEQEMGVLKQKLADNQKELSKYIDHAVFIADRLLEEEKKGISSAAASIYRSSGQAARRKIEDQKKKILSIENALERKRLKLSRAMVEKKVVEKLKEKDRKKYLMELSRINQKEMDEIASMRHENK